MDEDLEAEKIRKLEDRMKLFEKTANGDVVTSEPPTARAGDSEHSSESSSDDDSSGSESE
jgi:hypothetical protein